MGVSIDLKSLSFFLLSNVNSGGFHPVFLNHSTCFELLVSRIFPCQKDELKVYTTSKIARKRKSIVEVV